MTHSPRQHRAASPAQRAINAIPDLPKFSLKGTLTCLLPSFGPRYRPTMAAVIIVVGLLAAA